jgi:hypothetical protein
MTSATRCYTPAISQRPRDHIIEYRRSLAVWREKNLSVKICHECAAASTKEKFRLEPEEQLAVDAWLDEKYPERKKEMPPDDFPLFDVPTVQ